GRFAVRPATIRDAAEISRVQTESWQTSYRGILPDRLLDTIDVAHREAMRRQLLNERTGLHLVAYDATHRDLVGFCYASKSLRTGPRVAELHEIYLVDRAKRYGLGRELFDGVTRWCHASRLTKLVLWVLEANHPARRFYEAMGGKPGSRLQTAVRGYPVTELSYVWDRL
ncbi:MAG: N-acetyltransferase family protein, partial [Kofleriaceae bacterium]